MFSRNLQHPALQQTVLALRGLASPVPVVLIDGPAGAGKSTLADGLVAQWPGDVVPVLVRMDDIYPGWEGLAAGSELLRSELLAPLRSGAVAGWHRFDWTITERAEWHPIDPARPVVVDGCGTITAENAALADLRVWLSADDDVRKCRALARDHGGFDPYWDIWQAQFAAFVCRENPVGLADLILDGTPGLR